MSSRRSVDIIKSVSFQVPVYGRVTTSRLKIFFRFDHVSSMLLDEGGRVHREHESCRDVDEETNVVRRMELLTEFSIQPFWEDLISCAAQKGLRPATKHELYWFLKHFLSLAEKHGLLRLQTNCSAIALGSFIEVDGRIYVAEIVDDDEYGLFFQARKLAKEYPCIGARESVLFVHVQ